MGELDKLAAGDWLKLGGAIGGTLSGDSPVTLLLERAPGRSRRG
jgi:hypothetical protein